MSQLARLLPDRRASMGLWAAIMLGLSILITGGVVDYISLRMQKGDLQHAVDAAALSAAQELALAAGAEDRVQPVAQTYVTANYTRPATVAAEVIEKGSAVHVSASSPPRVFFPGPIGRNAGPVRAEAIAETIGTKGNVCVVALEDDHGQALALEDSASLDATHCSIYSNSPDPKGISAKDSSRLKGEFICSAGGKEGSVANYSPAPLLDCPKISDPLKSRPTPPVGACNYNHLKKENFTGTLSPGVYCGGLEIKGNSKVTLNPGVYVIKDGTFRVGDTAEMTGENVGFYLTGAATRFEFTKESVIHLSAPKTGPMAGLLFFEDNTILKDTEHKITSDFADYLVGTIYLPRGKFTIDATQDVAAESEFTVLVVRVLELKDGPRLVLNTDYSGTTVPVPDGVGNKGGKGVRLAH